MTKWPIYTWGISTYGYRLWSKIRKSMLKIVQMINKAMNKHRKDRMWKLNALHLWINQYTHFINDNLQSIIWAKVDGCGYKLILFQEHTSS